METIEDACLSSLDDAWMLTCGFSVEFTPLAGAFVGVWTDGNGEVLARANVASTSRQAALAGAATAYINHVPDIVVIVKNQLSLEQRQ